mgnify:FL=1
MQKSKFEKSILVEVPITAATTGKSFQFPDTPQLVNKFVQGVEVFTVTQVAKTPTQATTVAAAGATGIMVNLQVNNDAVIENIPYYTLISSLNGGLIREFKNIPLNVTKSTILIGDATNIVANTVALICVYYTDKPVI